MQIFPGQTVIFFKRARILYKDVLNFLNRLTIMKKKKMRITLADFILANRRASRAEEIEKYGQQVHNRRMVHKSKKKYDRKAMKRAVIKGDDSSYCLFFTICNFVRFIKESWAIRFTDTISSWNQIIS